jgi:hypothetical protein
VKLSDLITSSVSAAEIEDSRITTQRLKTWCRMNKWPEDVVSQLSIVHKDGEYKIYYPPHLSAKINFLEYGDQDTPPSAVFRNFLTNFIDQDSFATGMSNSLRLQGLI